MTAAKQPPGLPDPDTGVPASVRDLRAEFEQLSRKTARDRNAERAFIEARIEMIRRDPRLSPADKRRLTTELRRQL